MNQNIASVSDLVHGVKSILESEYRTLAVVGEITNISKTVAGHVYFTLSDENAQVSCAFFRGDVMRSSHMRKVKEGDKIVIQGNMSVYAKRGVFQVIVKRVMPFGKGDLRAQFEQLKAKFEKLGYFNSEHKKELPKYPKRIAVITAPHGAALQDFLNVIKRRSLSYDIVIIPAIVQGQESAKSLLEALKKAQEIKDIEAIVLTRGGGAMEDLWSFNDEKLIEEIFQCETPVISAVGHQVDFTLCDFVSDLRAETPTAAAQYLSEYQSKLLISMQSLARRLKVILFENQSLMQKKLSRINPQNILSLIKMNFNNQQSKLNQLNYVDRAHTLVNMVDNEQNLEGALEKMNNIIHNKYNEMEHRVGGMNKLLNSLNPNNVLNRGYTYVLSEGNALETKKEFNKSKSNEFEIIFKDGKQKVKKVVI